MKYYLGIDLGGTNIATGVIDEKFQFVASHNVATLGARQFDVVVRDMAEAAREVLKKAGLSEKDIEYVGIGAPSTIEPETQHLVFANNLGWKNVDLAGEFQKNWDIPVRVANDADCAALGESLAGAAKGFRNVLMLTLGTGVGGSFIMEQKIFLGGNGYGCEPGHSTLVYNGFPCTCGRRGCLEAYASVTALIRETLEMVAAYPNSLMREMCNYDMRKVSGRTAFDAAKKGDEAALRVVENYVGYLAAGIGSLVTSFRPAVVILGGGLSNEGEYLLEPVRRLVRETVYAADLMEPPAILKAALGNDAGIIGAALLGR
ncbi:MAG: ROK family protein [Ruthenibacterium sp.]